MSNAKRIQREQYIHQGDYTFVVPSGVNKLHIRGGITNRWKNMGGATHALSVDIEGKVWGWGTNNAGQLGTGGVSGFESLPLAFDTMKNTKWRKAVAGNLQSAGLSEYGVPYVWGITRADGVAGAASSPVLIPALAQFKAVDIWAGNGCTFIKTDDGQVYACGLGTNGQLGNGAATTTSAPTLVAGGLRWKRIATGIGTHAMGLAENGTLYSWGSNASGQHGNGTVTATSSPVVTTISSIRDFDVGSAHSMFIFNAFGIEGTQVLCMGQNANGQLGDGTVVPKSIATLVAGLPAGKKWKQVAAGANFSLALSEDGLLYGWGQNNFGQVPGTIATAVSTPVLLNNTQNWNVLIREISAMGDTGYAVDTRNVLWAWGAGSSGQTGDGFVANGTITKPDFAAFAPTPRYVPRYPAVQFREDGQLDVVPGEILTIKVREFESTIISSRVSSGVVYQKTDITAIGLDYWGD